jgi:drug/metabolite transporter, DME family
MSQSPADATRSRLLLLGAALLWSIGGVLAKSPWIAEIPLEQRGAVLACYRALFAAAALAPFVKWRRVRWGRGLMLTALAYAAMNILYLSALTRTTAAAAIFLQYTAIGWAVVLGWLCLRERPRRADWLALLFAGGGIACIVWQETSAQHAVGNLIGLASGVAYAGVAVGLRALRSEDPVWVVMFSNLTAGLVLLPWVASMPVGLSVEQWGILAAFGVIQLAIPYLLFAVAVRAVPAHEVVARSERVQTPGSPPPPLIRPSAQFCSARFLASRNWTVRVQRNRAIVVRSPGVVEQKVSRRLLVFPSPRPSPPNDTAQRIEASRGGEGEAIVVPNRIAFGHLLTTRQPCADAKQKNDACNPTGCRRRRSSLEGSRRLPVARVRVVRTPGRGEPLPG